jgi:hypothetical protein
MIRSTGTTPGSRTTHTDQSYVMVDQRCSGSSEDTWYA